MLKWKRWLCVGLFGVGTVLVSVGCSQNAVSEKLPYVESYYTLTVQEVDARAQAGDPFAQQVLANVYYWGSHGYPADEEKSKFWLAQAVDGYRELAGKNNAAAMVRIGGYYERGNTRLGLDADIQKAIAYYQNAAKLGDAAAQFNLGQIYRHGTGGVEVDMALSEHWYKQALPEVQRLAGKGEAIWANRLALMYRNGLGGMDVDLEKEAYWQDVYFQAERAFFASTHDHVIDPMRTFMLAGGHYFDNDPRKAYIVVSIAQRWMSSPKTEDYFGYFIRDFDVQEDVDAVVEGCLKELTEDCY